ncbi:hypothetical protein [Streptomyces sp. NPDC005898]|uniref:hypothetical protein n=1 Tax=Streptomyces sp. NPDC005898 TaxID=3157082 RepID=UPI003401BE5B
MQQKAALEEPVVVVLGKLPVTGGADRGENRFAKRNATHLRLDTTKQSLPPMVHPEITIVWTDSADAGKVAGGRIRSEAVAA